MNEPANNAVPEAPKQNTEPFSVNGIALRTMTDEQVAQFEVEFKQELQDTIRAQMQILQSIHNITNMMGAIQFEKHRRANTLIIASSLPH